MLRGITSLILILGILLCPLSCGEAPAAEYAATSTQCIDACCGCSCDQSTGDRQNGPSPCHDGCDRDCICKGLLEWHGKSLLNSSHYPAPGYGVGDIATASPASEVDLVGFYNRTHPSISSGIAVRLAFASLLL
jgi:hypothetical protein